MKNKNTLENKSNDLKTLLMVNKGCNMNTKAKLGFIRVFHKKT